MVYIALIGLFVVAGLVAMILLSGEGKDYSTREKSNFPGDLML
ncbi:MAG TPA: hypothetical protein VK177_06695 [Flavobacteriales bacterium]|nr:hypothetical protein [Flavobacteriales bacterium]